MSKSRNSKESQNRKELERNIDAIFASGGSGSPVDMDYDDYDLFEQIGDTSERVTALETQLGRFCSTMQTTIVTLQREISGLRSTIE